MIAPTAATTGHYLYAIVYASVTFTTDTDAPPGSFYRMLEYAAEFVQVHGVIIFIG